MGNFVAKVRQTSCVFDIYVVWHFHILIYDEFSLPSSGKTRRNLDTTAIQNTSLKEEV
jgi:hypothetical protein